MPYTEGYQSQIVEDQMKSKAFQAVKLNLVQPKAMNLPHQPSSKETKYMVSDPKKGM